MSIVNEDDFKSIWKQRYGSEPAYYSELYKFRNASSDTTLEDKELVNRVEIGGVYFKVEE